MVLLNTFCLIDHLPLFRCILTVYKEGLEKWEILLLGSLVNINRMTLAFQTKIIVALIIVKVVY